MDRHVHPKFVPHCPVNVAFVDQYQYNTPDKDHNVYLCENGLSTPVYSCDGNIHQTLPLERYPRAGTVHNDIRLGNLVHFQGHPRGSQMGVHPHALSRLNLAKARLDREPYTPDARRAYGRYPYPDVYGYVAGSCANA
uniref:Uncharacterized protein n=1 Tax=Marseillevirus LCMAC103 TaxID=2506604 RepID=A0A481YVV4_9VIRU|nr:MAG: hypothetical protein LCMAC103_03750 [Marseillevirus LCMAC103]